MPFVNDGEFRRLTFNESFAVVEGMEPWYARLAGQRTVAAGVEAAGLKREVGNEFRVPISGKLRLKHNALLDEVAFVTSIAHRPATVTLLSLDRIFQRYAPEGSGGIYPTIDAFLNDAAAVQQQMVCQLGDAGWPGAHRAPSYTSYIEMLAGMRSRDEDPAANHNSIAADNSVFTPCLVERSGFICRGNSNGMAPQRHLDAIASTLYHARPSTVSARI